MRTVNHGLGRVRATFDDDRLVGDAGLILVATVVSVLGLEALVNATVRLVGRAGGSRPGRKVLTLVHAMAVGRTASMTPTGSGPAQPVVSWAIG